MENPHYSDPERAGSVLFKTRVYLTGPGPLMIHHVGIIRSAPGLENSAPPESAFTQAGDSSDDDQLIQNLGPRTYGGTFYTPRKNQPPVLGTQWYEGGSLIDAPNPPPGNVQIESGVGLTNKVFLRTP